jgi:hypothetical protein
LSTTLQTTVDKVTDQVNHTVHETVEALEDYFGVLSNLDDYAMMVAKNLIDNFGDDNDFELEDLLPPNLNVSSFDDDLKAVIPNTDITFRFDDLDLYLELETIHNVSATYTVKLFQNGAIPIGLDLPNNIKFGVVVSADLILNITGGLDITGGLHIKVDDHVATRIKLFGDEVSEMNMRVASVRYI